MNHRGEEEGRGPEGIGRRGGGEQVAAPRVARAAVSLPSSSSSSAANHNGSSSNNREEEEEDDRAVTIPILQLCGWSGASNRLDLLANERTDREGTRKQPVVIGKLELRLDRSGIRIGRRARRLFREEDVHHFRQFVERLTRHDFRIHHVQFDTADWTNLPPDGMELLFGTVLPSYPGLRAVGISSIALPAPYLRLLADSMVAAGGVAESSLRKLSLNAAPVSREQIQAITAMVGRKYSNSNENICLEELTVTTGGEPRKFLTEEDGRALCQAVARNRHLRRFTVRIQQILADTLDDIASASSSLRELDVGGCFPNGEGVANVARQLRTNTTMTCLHFVHSTPVHFYGLGTGTFVKFQPLVEVLETYNFTLLTVTVNQFDARWGSQPRVVELLRRNERIRRALAQLEPRSYRIEPLQLAPRVLDMVSGVPTLLFRFLRRGNLHQLLARQPLGVSEDDARAIVGCGWERGRSRRLKRRRQR